MLPGISGAAAVELMQQRKGKGRDVTGGGGVCGGVGGGHHCAVVVKMQKTKLTIPLGQDHGELRRLQSKTHNNNNQN